MTMQPWFQFLILLITLAGLLGLAGLLYLVWPFRRERGGLALVTLILGFTVTFCWLLALDTAAMIYGAGVLPFPSARALVARALIAGSVWSTLAMMRWRRP
jgi:hypothetical protein